jgi:hypothetical protein
MPFCDKNIKKYLEALQRIPNWSFKHKEEKEVYKVTNMLHTHIHNCKQSRNFDSNRIQSYGHPLMGQAH